MRIEFEDIPLETVQKDLLAAMVEAERSQKEREPFLLIRMSNGAYVHHAGFSQDESIYPGDLMTLADYGLLRLQYTSQGNEMYDVTAPGRQYYEWMRQQQGEAIERVEDEVRRLLDRGTFPERHAVAYRRWADAEASLWGAETLATFTEIGHACREAVQQLVTDLVEKHHPADVNPDPQKTVDRLRAVIGSRRLSETIEEFAVALLAYFGAVSDLIMRQEHGAQKEGEELVWEDALRVVFQTAMVMFELDRTLG